MVVAEVSIESLMEDDVFVSRCAGLATEGEPGGRIVKQIRIRQWLNARCLKASAYEGWQTGLLFSCRKKFCRRNPGLDRGECRL
jgi:hypothetical protein